MTKKKKMNRLIALALTMMMFVCLLPAKAAWAFNPENYRAQITKISVGTPLTDTDTGKKYLPVTVYFTAEEDLGDSSVEFLEGYLKVKLANGQTAEGITGLGMTLIGMGALKPDAFPPFPNDNNMYSWSWSEGTGTGVLKYNIPLLDSDATQTVETSLATEQEEVNGIKPGDQIGFQIETVMNVPSDVLPEGGLFSDIFRFTVEDTSNYPKEITISEGGGSDSKTISIPKGLTLTYNGEEQTGVLPGSGYSLEGKIKATDAGLYVAYVTPDWGYSWVDGTGQMTKIVDWSIKKAELNVVALTKEEFTYNGKVQKPEIQSVKANGVAVPESEYTAKIPEEKNAGRYTVQVTAKTGSNNFTGTASGDFTIRQMDLDDAQVIYPEEMSETDIYTKEQAREIKLKDLVKGEDYTQSITSKKDDNDQYNWVVTYTAKGNNTTGKLVVQVRKDPAEKDPESVVETPMATITKNPTANTLTYTGEEQKLVTEGQASGGTMSYALGKNDTVVPGRGWSETVPTATNSGTYYVWYKAVGDDSHRDSDAFCVTVSISKNNPKYTSEWVKGKWYNKDGTQTYKYRGSWKKKKNRTRFGTESGWYAKNCWQKIDGKWYFFDQDGNREENTWRKGWHLGADGSWDGKDKAEGWRLTDDGWTFIDADGNMLNSGWETIDEKWYYFHETGVAAQSEFVNGWWLSKDCSWTYPHRSRWKKRKGKWTYSDSSGWKAKNATYKIDSKKQSFDNDGNWIEE